MMLASLSILQCILTSIGARESGYFSAEEKGLVLAEHPATDIAPDAKTTAQPCVLLHGDSRLVEPRAGHTVVDQNIDCCMAQ